MQLKNHIAYRFLTEEMFVIEMVTHHYPNLIDAIDAQDEKGVPIPEEMQNKAKHLYILLKNEDQKSYYATESVLDKLDMLSVSKKDGAYDWTVFSKAKEGKYTFIFPKNAVLRIWIHDDTIEFCYLSFVFEKGSAIKGQSHWVLFFLNRETNELCEHFEHEDVKNIETFVYKFLCFFFLTQNEEIEVQPKQRFGTRKAGKVINDLPFKLTVVNSKWGKTVINSNGFSVSGHLAIRWTGIGRTNPRIVFINPFEKKGYKRIYQDGKTA
jgi:hypothetical protein